MRYKVFDPEAKVIGQAMLGFKAAANQEIIGPLLEKYGLTNIQPDYWYPQQTWLDLLSDISEQTGDYASMLTFVDIGTKVAASVAPPQGIIEKFQANFIDAFYELDPLWYQHDHQGDVGTFIVEKLDKNHVRCLLHTPYPPDFWYGALYGTTKRFCSSFVVHFEDIAMRHYDTSQTIIIHMIIG